MRRSASGEGLSPRPSNLAWMKVVDWVFCPLRITGFGGSRFLHGQVGPVSLPLRSLLNPLGKDFLFPFGQFLFALRRGHDLVWIVRYNTVPGFTILSTARNNGGKSILLEIGFFGQIKSQVGFAEFFRGAMAMKTFSRKNGPDISVELNGFFCTPYGEDHE